MQWFRTSFRPAGLTDHRDIPFLVDPDFSPTPCPGIWEGSDHYRADIKPPIKIAWTGMNVPADFFLITSNLLIASERAVRVLSDTNIRGFHIDDSLDHLGIAERVEIGDEIDLTDLDVGNFIRGFRQLVVEREPTFSKYGRKIITCPECGHKEFKAEFYDPSMQLEFPARIDIVQMPASTGAFFTTAKFREVAKRERLVGVIFEELGDLATELSRDADPRWMVACARNHLKQQAELRG